MRVPWHRNARLGGERPGARDAADTRRGDEIAALGRVQAFPGVTAGSWLSGLRVGGGAGAAFVNRGGL